MTTYTADEVETALCVWEHVLVYLKTPIGAAYLDVRAAVETEIQRAEATL